jgi:hypothetical protein
VHLAHAARAPTPPDRPTGAQGALQPADAFALFAVPDGPPPHFVRRAARAATTAGVGVVLFFLAADLVALFAGVPTALAYTAASPDPIVPIYLAFPFPFLLFEFGGAAAAAWHLVLVGTIVAAAAAFLRGHLKGAWALLMAVFEGRGAPPLSEQNGLFAFARLYSVSIMSAFAVSAIAAALNQTPAVPQVLQSEPFGAALIGLAHASVFEELVTRVLLLGAPLALIALLGRGRLEGGARRYLLGGAFVLEGPALAFLVFQAVVFGAAHVPGWDLWKFPSTFVTGLALGVLFLRYGLAPCIVFHFVNDYLSATVEFTRDTSFPLLVFGGLMVLMAVGVANAGRYLVVLSQCLRAGRVPEYCGGPPTGPTAAAAAPAAAAPPQGGAPPEGPSAPPDGKG